MAEDLSKDTQSRQGVGIDFRGDPVIDPSANVQHLTEAAVKRLDDLGTLTQKFNDTQFKHIRDIVDKNEKHAAEMIAVKSAYDEKINAMESRRIDAIRQVDVTASAVAGQRADTAIETLAKQTAADRETLRAAVVTSANTLATQNSETVAQLVGRIGALELALSKTTGKEAVSDPMLVQMVAKLEALGTVMTEGAGKDKGMDKIWGYLVALVTAAIGAGFYIAKP